MAINNTEERIQEYFGKSEYLLLLKSKLNSGEKLSVSQRLLANNILEAYAIANNKKEWVKPAIKQFKIDWDKYEAKKPFDFQKEGINWLLNIDRAILADEQGLGKGVQTPIAAIESKAKSILIICPKILKLNWKNEIKMFDDESNIAICDSKKLDLTKKWVILNYDNVKKHLKALQKHKFDLMICDEAQKVKSLNSLRTKAVKTLSNKIKKVWLLTGTPIANKPIDFYSLLKILKHSLGKNKADFVRAYCGGELTPWGYQVDGASNLKELHFKTQDIILRRLKKDCLSLPDKISAPIELELSNYKEYKTIAEDYINNKYLATIDPDSEDYGKEVKGEQFMELAVWRKYCAMEKIKDGSTFSLIEDSLENDEKVIVFSNYRDVIDSVKEKYGDECVILYGGVSDEEREKRITRFQNDPKCKIIAANIIVAGAGLTLTAATISIFNDLPWSPSDLSQASDRFHRIGQTKKVTLYFPFYKKTIDEVMYQVVQEKIKNISLAIEGKATEGLLSGDIRKEVYSKLKKQIDE